MIATPAGDDMIGDDMAGGLVSNGDVAVATA